MLAPLDEIDAITRTKVNPHLSDALPNRPHVAKIAKLEKAKAKELASKQG